MSGGISELSGFVQTVSGPIDPEELGITLVHEHLLIDGSFYYKPPQENELHRASEEIALENLNWIRKNNTSNLSNLRLDDENVACKEATAFKEHGGRSIVDVGSVGLKRNPEGLRRIAKKTGLNIVMGSGYYVKQSHPVGLEDRSDKDIEDEIVRDIVEGVGDTGIRAGIIGELGCSWPLDPVEEKVLRAGAAAQRKTGAPLSIHIGRHHQSPIEIAKLLQENGAILSKVTMSHLDRDIPDYATLRTLAQMGCYLEFDMFGQETSDYPYTPIDRITDWQRVHVLRDMIVEGFVKQLVLSHDIGHKHRLETYGGHGYAHLNRTVVPLMLRKNISPAAVTTMMVENPKRLMQFI